MRIPRSRTARTSATRSSGLIRRCFSICSCRSASATLDRITQEYNEPLSSGRQPAPECASSDRLRPPPARFPTRRIPVPRSTTAAPVGSFAVARRIVRMRQLPDCCHRRELRYEVHPALRHRLCHLRLVIGEVEEWSGGREFLPLKRQRRVRPEQQQRGQRAIPAGGCQLLQPPAGRRVRDLIVILEITDRCGSISREALPRRCFCHE